MNKEIVNEMIEELKQENQRLTDLGISYQKTIKRVQDSNAEWLKQCGKWRDKCESLKKKNSQLVEENNNLHLADSNNRAELQERQNALEDYAAEITELRKENKLLKETLLTLLKNDAALNELP